MQLGFINHTAFIQAMGKASHGLTDVASPSICYASPSTMLSFIPLQLSHQYIQILRVDGKQRHVNL